MDRPNSSVSSKAKDSFSQFLETSFVSKNTVHISKGNSIPWIQGKTELTGNSCPRGHAYSGAGYCTEIRCWDSFWDRHPELVGWDCKKSGLLIGKPIWGSRVIKAVMDPKCPYKEPIIGRQSSCTTQADRDAMRAAKKKKKRKPIGCRNGTLRKDHPKCRDQGITSPMDMD